MSDELGYIPSSAGPGKDKYSKPLASQNIHNEPKARQDGVKQSKKGEQAEDCLSNNNAENNNDPGSY